VRVSNEKIIIAENWRF